MHTNTPQVVVGIVEPWTLRLTARTLLYQISFLLSAMNTQYREVGLKGQNPVVPVVYELLRGGWKLA